ncbi:MAG: thioredoxin family protein [Actinobacteria bacterium]|nr:thioredoxin family protein [Actinomycetota bacterium]
MSPTASLLVLAVLLGGSLLVGVLLSRRSALAHAVRTAERIDPADLATAGSAPGFGERGTVVQFSTAYCSRCPATRRTITETVAARPELAFVHLDVTDRPDLASRFRLSQTPTVLILDHLGVPRARLSGAVSAEALHAGLDSTIGIRP